MGLMKGSLYSLLDGKSASLDYLNSTANTMLSHILQALVCEIFLFPQCSILIDTAALTI